MVRTLASAALIAAAAACAPDAAAPGGGAGANPFEYCRGQGLAVDSEAFEDCVAEAIEQRCAAAGAPGSDAHARCVQQQRNATFVRDQLQIRGF